MSKNNITSIIVLIMSIILLLGACIGIVNIASITEASAEDNNTIQSDPQDNTIQQFCYFTTNDTFLIGNNYGDIIICVNTDSELERIKVVSSTFSFFSYEKLDTNSFVVSIACLDNTIDYYLSFECVLNNNTSIKSNIFAICNDYGIFYSDFSLDEARDKSQSYIRNNIEKSKAKKEDTINSVSKDTNITYEDAFALEKELSQTRGSKDTYVSGNVSWYDDNNTSHPLRNARIQAYDANSVGGDKLLGVTNTNYYGNYSITFQNNDTIFDHYGSDVYIRVYASDGNILVKRQTGSAYTQDSATYNDVSTGSTTTIDMSFNVGTDMAKAVQIFQAVEVGQYYAASMIGSTPTGVNVIYPYSDPNNPTGGCFYRNSESTIYIVDRGPKYQGDPYSYASWDVITHEYGHHIEYEMGIINLNGVPTYSHGFNSILSNDLLSKDYGIRVAWAEAWATAFGIIAQREYPYSISSISTADDLEYSSYNGAYINVETSNGRNGNTMRSGESCEGSIIAALWDIYDGANEAWDDIDLSASEWWDITTISETYTFSKFVQNFYDEYPEYESELGELLEYYKMCPSNFTWTWGSTTMSPPTISWSNDSGWTGYPFDYVLVMVSNYTDTIHQIVALGNTSGGTLTQEQWNTIIGWHTSELHLVIYATHNEAPETGAYATQTYIIDMPQFTTALKANGTLEITGPIGNLTGSVVIPSTLCNNTAVTSISNNAFSGQTSISSVSIPSSITSIGAYAFSNCTNLTSVYMSSANINRIEDHTFYNCPLTSLSWPNNNIAYIGNYAFFGSNLARIIITNETSYIGAYAFGDNSNLTIYSQNYSTGWDLNWNSSNRPFIWGCNLSSDGSYVISFEKTAISPMQNYNGTINNPTRSGYTFSAWYTTPDYAGTSYSTVESAPNGWLYAKWNSNSSGGSCITEGSLITLADGTQTAVENLTGNEELLVWDMLNGTFSSAPILFIDSESTTIYDVITLTFSDGTQVEVIDEHAFFDVTLNKYVFLRNDASQYIGHFFTKHNQMLTGIENVQLVDVDITPTITTAYSPVTYGHLCYYVNGMLSMPGNTESFINIFEVDPTIMAYDEDSMLQDIATYGLYTYEEFNNIIPIPELVFNAFNGQYLKVAIGKGITTLQEIQSLLDRYSVFFE